MNEVGIHMKTLIIGSTTVDIIIKLPHLPSTCEDINTPAHIYSLGGCAYNVSHMFHLFELPYTLCTPQGTGLYGDYVRNELAKKGITLPIETNEPHGACVCLVDSNGERSFLCHHGTEYFFHKEHLEQVDTTDVNQVYICGLEIEEPTGDNIIDYLETLDATIFFAPGPRILSIPQAKLDRLFKLSPVIHLNEQEITSYTKTSSIEEACLQLSKLTNNDIIVTLGEKGAYYYHEHCGTYIPGNPSTVVDTIGAGDSHLGSYMAALQMGYTPENAIALANTIASQVVQIEGASLTKEQFKRVFN